MRGYYPGWVSIDNELAEAPVEELEGPLLEEVRRSIRADYAADFLVTDGGDVETSIGAYALVISNGARPADTAIIVRQRNPVEKLGQGRFTARWSGEQLDKVESVFVFDAGVDIVVWRDVALIRSARVLEALFVGEEIRREGARRAIETLNDRVPLSNRPELEATIEADSVFAARFRNIERRGLLATLDLDALQRSSEKSDWPPACCATRGWCSSPSVAGASIGWPRWRIAWSSQPEAARCTTPKSNEFGCAAPWKAPALLGTVASSFSVALTGDRWLLTRSSSSWSPAMRPTTWMLTDVAPNWTQCQGPGGLELALLGPPEVTTEQLVNLPPCSDEVGQP